jgi:hypothetical protein
MPNSRKNRNGIKGRQEEDRRGNSEPGYEKLPDNPDNPADENISTADDVSNPKFSRTSVRKEDKNAAKRKRRR